MSLSPWFVFICLSFFFFVSEKQPGPSLTNARGMKGHRVTGFCQIGVKRHRCRQDSELATTCREQRAPRPSTHGIRGPRPLDDSPKVHSWIWVPGLQRTRPRVVFCFLPVLAQQIEYTTTIHTGFFNTKLKKKNSLVKQNKIRRKGTFSQTSKISSTVYTWAFLVHWEETIAVVQSCDYFVPLGEQLAQKSRGMCPGRSDSYTVSQSKPWALNINDGMMILSLSCLGCLWLNQSSIN